MERPIFSEKICESCGKKFTTPDSNRKLCNNCLLKKVENTKGGNTKEN